MIGSGTAFGIVATAGAAPTGGFSLVSMLPFVLIALIFYFLLIAPERKRRKQHQMMLDNLKAGDKVVTGGGIHGTVVGVTDTIVQLKVARDTKIDVAKHAIASRQEEPDKG